MNHRDIIQTELTLFEKSYHWLEEHMPKSLIAEFSNTYLVDLAHHLVGLKHQEYYVQIRLPNISLVLSLDYEDVDLRILKNFGSSGIKSYETFISDSAPPGAPEESRLFIAAIKLTETEEEPSNLLSIDQKQTLFKKVELLDSLVDGELLNDFLEKLSLNFLSNIGEQNLSQLLHLGIRASQRDHIQFELKESKLLIAWKNTPKKLFLFRLASLLHRQSLRLEKAAATSIDLPNDETLLLMSLHLKGNLTDFDREDFIRELCFLKFSPYKDLIEEQFIKTHLLKGNLANIIRCMASFIHQFLLQADIYLYSLPNILEGLTRHPELTLKACHLFERKFHPLHHDIKAYESEKTSLLDEISHIDTGNHLNDVRRKNILKGTILFSEFCLKTNFYRENKCSLSFRFDPNYLNYAPYDREQKFPELPFAIFMVMNDTFLGFQIRFKDLARGGLRTVLLPKEQTTWEINNVFLECYNLALTQQKKNKDIPEGGAKAIIFLDIHERLEEEGKIFRKELLRKSTSFSEEILEAFLQKKRLVYLYEAQRAFIHSLLTLINCEEDGRLRAKDVIDYYKKPEYIYLGPDENMHNSMLEWIAKTSCEVNYKPKKAFISSKPGVGINHKEFGVTSHSVHIAATTVLKHLKIDPSKDLFTVKISGGPDGDVAGNELMNLFRDFPTTARIVALTDGTGTIQDKNGLDLPTLKQLFLEGKGIRHYPPNLLSDNGFLLDMHKKREESHYSIKTLLWKKESGTLIEEYISANLASHLYRSNLFTTKADLFIPAGGRPRTLSKSNMEEFLDAEGHPTAKAIIEGGNLYLTYEAREFLESKGVIIIKDSSANKGGVVCSSFEVLSGLLLSDEEFLQNKPRIVQEILDFIGKIALNETRLILASKEEIGLSYTAASEKISERINYFTYQILDYLTPMTLSTKKNDPLIRSLFAYVLPIFREEFEDRLITHLPDMHKKAIISCFIASNIIYRRGLCWVPSITEILDLLVDDILSP